MKSSAFLASCANILCLIHCVGFVALGAISPLFLVWLEHLWWLDLVVLGVNLVFGNVSMLHMQVSKKYIILFNLLILMAFATVKFHAHSVFHWLILAMAIMQIILLVNHHRGKKHSPECCDHQHK